MKELGPTNGEKASVIRSLFNLDFGDATVAAATKVTRGLGDRLRERRNLDLANLLIETGSDREGAKRAFAAVGRAVKAKDISGETARKLMIAVVRGGGQEVLGDVTRVPGR